MVTLVSGVPQSFVCKYLIFFSKLRFGKERRAGVFVKAICFQKKKYFKYILAVDINKHLTSNKSPLRYVLIIMKFQVEKKKKIVLNYSSFGHYVTDDSELWTSSS